MRRTFWAYSSGVTAPQQAPGPSPTWQSKQGLASRFRKASESFSSARVSPRQSAQVAAHRGTTRRAMSIISRAARASVKGPKYFVSDLCFSRVYLMAGNTSPLVSAMKG